MVLLRIQFLEFMPEFVKCFSKHVNIYLRNILDHKNSSVPQLSFQPSSDFLQEDPNRLVFQHFCYLISSLLEVLAANQASTEEQLSIAWPLDLAEFAQEVSNLLTDPPGPAGDPEESASLSIYLDPLGSLASVDVLGVMMLLKSIVRRTAQVSDNGWTMRLVESVFALVFELPTLATEDRPLLRKKKEREEAYNLLETLAGSSKCAFTLLGSQLLALHSSWASEYLDPYHI